MFGDVAFAQSPFASLGGASYVASQNEAATADDIEDVAGLTKGGPIHEAASALAAQNVLAVMLGRVNEAATAAATNSVIGAMFVATNESALAASAQSVVASFVGSINEAVSGVEFVSVQSAFVLSLLEAATGADSVLGVRGQYVAVQEAASIDSETTVPRVIWSGTVTEAASAIESISVIRAAHAYVEGIQLFVQIGDVLVWAVVDDSQSANWQNITNSQSVVWASIDDTQSPSWSAVGTVQSANWTDIDDNQAPDWNNIPS